MFEEKNLILITIVGTFLVIFLSVTLFIFFYYYQKRKFKHIREKQQLQTNFRQELCARHGSAESREMAAARCYSALARSGQP